MKRSAGGQAKWSTGNLSQTKLWDNVAACVNTKQMGKMVRKDSLIIARVRGGGGGGGVGDAVGGCNVGSRDTPYTNNSMNGSLDNVVYVHIGFPMVNIHNRSVHWHRSYVNFSEHSN